MLTNIKINNIEFQEDSSLTILQVAKKRGIAIPTLCYLKKDDCNFEHKPASCRVCIVEVKGRRNLVPACSTLISEGMEIFTNSPRVLNERRTVVELLLSNHPNDCLTCSKSTHCSLQTLAHDLGIKRHAITGPLSQDNVCITSGSLVRNASKCVLCNRCTAVCKEIQGIGAISASSRGFSTIISQAYKCVNCGQCVQVCPTGALVQVDNTSEVEKLLQDPNKYCIIQTAPAVRVSMGEGFGLAPGTDVTGRLVTSLRMLGFKKVFDTNFAADLTIMEEGTELLARIKEGKNLPLITSCCPGWIKFIETQFPELIHLPSSCKSPQEMFSAIAKSYYANKMGIDPNNLVVVSLMPCIAKKQELLKDEEKVDGIQQTDYSLSVSETIAMLKRYGIDLSKVPEGSFDLPLGQSTGAADIFANTGGVMEAAVRTVAMLLENDYPKEISFNPISGNKLIREATVTVDNTDLHLCVVSGLANTRKVLQAVKDGTAHYDAIEVMACPRGCINGGGQPTVRTDLYEDTLRLRKEGINNIDKGKHIRISCDNEAISKLYEEFLGQPGSKLAHHLLHTSYKDRSDEE